MRRTPGFAGCQYGPAESRPAGAAHLRSPYGGAAGHHSAADRQHACTTPSASPKSPPSTRTESVLRGDGSGSAILAVAGRPEDILPHPESGRRRRSRWTRSPSTLPPRSPVSVNHTGLFPSVTVSFNLAPGVSLGQATQEIDNDPAEARACRRRFTGSSPGRCRHFEQSLDYRALPGADRDPGRLYRAGDSLRKPDPSHHHSLDASAGQRGRAFSLC